MSGLKIKNLQSIVTKQKKRWEKRPTWKMKIARVKGRREKRED